MATRQNLSDFDLPDDEEEPASALALEEASSREDDNPGAPPDEQDFDEEKDETILEQVHKQYIEALEQGVSKTFAELYLAKFEGLYNLSGDK